MIEKFSIEKDANCAIIICFEEMNDSKFVEEKWTLNFVNHYIGYSVPSLQTEAIFEK